MKGFQCMVFLMNFDLKHLPGGKKFEYVAAWLQGVEQILVGGQVASYELFS